MATRLFSAASLTAAALSLAALFGAPAPAEPVPVAAAVAQPMGGGWTHNGTVTSKEHRPAYWVLTAHGKVLVREYRAECWALNVTRWGLTGYACVTRGEWERARPGDEVSHGRLVAR